ncbi:hypothetical protein QTP88_013423 [Uroleucon formosanum]
MQQIKGEVGGQEKSSAFSAKFQNKSRGKNGSYGKGKKKFITKNKVNCFYCGKIRHYKPECRSYIRSMNGYKISTKDTNLNAFVSESRINNTITNTWVLDSGASDHMSANIEWFSSYEPLEDTQQVTIGDGSNLYAIGKGNINILLFVNGNWNRNYLANVLHVPGLKFNLFSCGSALDKGLELTSKNKMCVFTRNGIPVCIVARCGRLFELQVKVEMPSKSKCYANITIEKRLQGVIVADENERSMAEKCPVLALTLAAWPLLSILRSLLLYSVCSIFDLRESRVEEPHNGLWLLKSSKRI